MASKYKEALNKKDVMIGDGYEIYSRKLNDGQKDYSGINLGDYIVIEPIFIDDYGSILPTPGWLCRNTKTSYYKVIPNLALTKMYTNYCSDKSFFGMEYVSSDISSTKLDPLDFKNRFFEEVEKEHRKRKDEYSEQKYKEYTCEIDRYVKNVSDNLAYFKTLSESDFNKELARIVSKYHFVEVDDISSYKNCLYLIVLGEYSQFYVGKSEASLKNRMRKHWNAKIIPARHLWTGGFESSRIKFDDFKMFDTTRIFVCDDIQSIISENKKEAKDKRIEITNTFSIERFKDMSALAIAERIVINNCRCMFCLSDRTPLMNFKDYSKLENIYGVPKADLLIKHFLRLDEKNPFKARFQSI